MTMTRFKSSMIVLCAVFAMGLVVQATPTIGQESDVAIKVNDEVVEKSQIQSRIDQMTQRMQQRRGNQSEGEQPSDRIREQVKQRVVDQTVDQLILKSHAKEADVNVSDQKVEEQLQSTIERFPSEEAYTQALEQQGMSEEKLRQQIREGLVVQTFLEDRLGEVSVSDEEARSYYEENSQRFQNRSFEEIKGAIKRSLEQRKRQEQRDQLVSNLREESDIEIRI